MVRPMATLELTINTFQILVVNWVPYNVFRYTKIFKCDLKVILHFLHL